MRAVELAKVAANAEALRLREMASRQSMRAVYGGVAAVFALGVLVLLHVVAYNIMVPNVSPVVASLILLAVDLVIAGVCGLKAFKSVPGTVETEALAIRKQAVHDMRGSITVMSMAGEALGFAVRPKRNVTLVRPRGMARLAGEVASRLLRR